MQQVDPDIQKRLPTAKIVERVYTNPHGPERRPDAADGDGRRGHAQPPGLLPLAGLEPQQYPKHAGRWAASDPDERTEEGGPAATVLYWLTGYFPPAPPRNALLQKAYLARMHIMGNHNNMSLFVRIIAPDTPLGRRALAEFTSDLRGPLQTLVGAGAGRSQNALLHRGF